MFAPRGATCARLPQRCRYSCLGGTWREIGGGGGDGCSCQDPSVYFGTGGAPSTGGRSSTGGTSAFSTGTAIGGASSTGGTSSNTAPVITSSGGSYSCPTAEPYGSQQAPCDCTNPPCECDYTYSWTADSGCGDSCELSLSYDYTCQDGVWQVACRSGATAATRTHAPMETLEAEVDSGAVCWPRLHAQPKLASAAMPTH